MAATPILYVIDELKLLGGAELHLIQVASRMQESGFKAMIFPLRCSREMVTKVRGLGVWAEESYIRRIYSIRGLRAAIRIAKVVREHDVKIIQTFHFDSDVLGVMVGRLMGVPVIISSRRDMGDWWRKRRHVMTYRLLRRFIDKVIVVSDAVGEATIRDEKWEREKIITIHNGVDVGHFDASFQRGGERNGLALREGHRIVSMIGNLHRIKGHRDFITAAASVVREYQEVQFLIVGEGDMMEELVRLRDDLGLTEKVLFLGRREDIREVLAATDVSVLCSESEGFSNTILECMSMGKAVVATQVGGNPEAVVHDVTGLLVPPGEPKSLARAVLKLIRDPGLCQGLGFEARKRAEEEFSSEVMIGKMEKLYSTLLREGVGRD